MFQSSPAPKGRCNEPPAHVDAARHYVSILTGPEGPMQPDGVQRAYLVIERFNPHRPRRADATVLVPAPSPRHLFQSSPAPKGRCNASRGCDSQRLQPVSILTGPEGPMQLDLSADYLALAEFQSSPAPKGRCNPVRVAHLQQGHRFQSSPAPKGRCNVAAGPQGVHQHLVSILTGPEGPMQPRLPVPLAAPPACFNPHRPRRADATCTV